MELFLEEHQAILEDLVRSGVEFLITGGYAVIYYGYVRTTGDLDIWLKPDEKNKMQLLQALGSRGISRESLKKIDELDFKDAAAFHLGRPPVRIDFFTQVTGLAFENAFAHAEILNLASFSVRILRFDDLLTNKMLTTRLKDKADVEELQKIRAMRGNVNP
jgi:hypothetical protein